MHTTNEKEFYDLVIVGGGMVGATLACALGNSGLSIAVIEANEIISEWPTGDVDYRVSAITPASQNIFMSLGVWDKMLERRISPFREMHVWNSGGIVNITGEIHFDSSEIGEARLGYIIENRVIQTALLERIGELDNVVFMSPASVISINITPDHAELQLDSGNSVITELLVGADGSHSRIRQWTGIETKGWPYDQKAVVATVRTEQPHNETAWQRFLPDGPLAFLPLNNGCCSIVWSTTPEHADALLAMDELTFLGELTDAFDFRLGRVESAGQRAAFPLRLQYIDTYVADHLALIGDAAHTIHPLAGQGVNLGLLDAATLAEVIVDAHARGKKVGAKHILRRYERWRKGNNLLIMAVMDGFNRLFGMRSMSLNNLRNCGLNLTNKVAPVKNTIMRHAMGMNGDLPRIAKMPVENVMPDVV